MRAGRAIRRAPQLHGGAVRRLGIPSPILRVRRLGQLTYLGCRPFPTITAGGGSSRRRPGPRHVRNQASRFFNTEEARRATEKARILALRVATDRTPREAPYWPSPWPSVALRASSVLKNLLACLGSRPGPVIGLSRPADAKICAPRKAAAPAAVMASSQRQCEPSEGQFFRCRHKKG
jgi:hypothetical protein